ncbi:AraC family transcriptional regulator [Desulfatibacillum aliphaticivorans]|uniref:AraC family transcriptional regulator n=1 Tax=Desulfatibacillum aliphaticivorans TaxID=218208 RepID=UPI0003F903A5|nr:AraC family transcriptional regulator [Desulfatibacillum aliphaticivorans]
MRRSNQENVRFFNLQDIPHIQAVHGLHVTNEFSRHVHDGFSIGIVLEGKRVIDQKGASVVIGPKDVFLINPGEPHACKSEDGKHTYFTICVEPEALKSFASQISEKAQETPYFSCLAAKDGELNSLIREFMTLVQKSGSTMEKEASLISILSTAILRYGNDPPELRRISPHVQAVNRTREYIKTHYAENLTLKELAGVACLSPFYFQRLFLENAGISPHDFLIQYRIKKARKMLEQGSSLADAALDVGFADQSHFTRAFKRVTGISPGRYIRNLQDM